MEDNQRPQVNPQSQSPKAPTTLSELVGEQVARERYQVWMEFSRERGARYEKCRLSNFATATDAQRKAVELLSDYSKNLNENIEAGKGIVLIGPPGTGKDHLITGLANNAIRDGRRPVWRNGQDMWGEIRDSISQDESETRQIARLSSYDILILSDLLPPRGSLTDFQSTTLFRIIDRRYSHLRPTWVTLNVADAKEAGERIGYQVVDRLGHDALVIKCNWPSYRSAAK